jgi:hypothetical protein
MLAYDENVSLQEPLATTDLPELASTSEWSPEELEYLIDLESSNFFRHIPLSSQKQKSISMQERLKDQMSEYGEFLTYQPSVNSLAMMMERRSAASASA